MASTGYSYFQGLYAFHMELSPGYKLIAETFYEHEKCGLKELDYMNLVSPWFVVAKHSPYKELIKTTLVFKPRRNRSYAKFPIHLVFFVII